jgi:transposase
MRASTLLPDVSELELVCLRQQDGAIQMELRTAGSSAVCPECHTPSRRVHSRYLRKLADLPWQGIPVVLQLQSRRFFCLAVACPRRVFTQRLPNTAARYARRTKRSVAALDWIALAAGGEPGSRLARRLGWPVRGGTLLRQLRRRNAERSAAPVPRVLGIDDWAWRKGHRYATILCDLEAGRVVDLLPDRTTETVAEWLRMHPGVEIVSRDRASAYAEAARAGAPCAVQVADRWHLLRSLSEALETALGHHHRMLTQAAAAIRPTTAPRPRRPRVPGHYAHCHNVLDGTPQAQP